MSGFDRYAVVEQMVGTDVCDVVFGALRMRMVSQPYSDVQCPLSHSEYGAPVAESLLALLAPQMEEATGLSLLPTYSYSRVYRPNDVLLKHTDRPSCEISCTLHVGRIGTDEPWPIYMDDARIMQNIGDAAIYRGMDVPHWRDEWEAPQGALYGQVFLHYVDANGPHAEWQFDGRMGLGYSKL